MTAMKSDVLSYDKTEEFGSRLATASVEYADKGSLQLISVLAYSFQLKYRAYLISVTPSADTEFLQVSEQSIQLAEKLENILTDSSLDFIESFAKAKYGLDELFLSCTKKGMLNYNYHRRGLLNSAEIQKELGISRATVSRYVKLGMETTEGTGHMRYPFHNVYYWNDGIWASKIQALKERYRLRNRTKKEALQELQNEIEQFETVYGSSFQDVFGEISDPYELNEPDDYFNWRDAMEDLEKLNG